METQFNHRYLYDYELAERRLKTLDEHELTERLFLSIQPWATYQEKAQIALSVELSWAMHEHQLYGGKPYIRHPLRVATRLHDYYGVRDANVISAALQHDIVEDHETELAALAPAELHGASDQETCFNLLAEMFNPDVSQLIRGVTNPFFGADLSLPEFQAAYQVSTSAKIRSDGRVAVIKLGDLDDNCLGLHHSPSLDFQARQAPKYLPILEVCEREVSQGNLPIAERRVDYVLKKLREGRVRMLQIIHEEDVTPSSI